MHRIALWSTAALVGTMLPLAAVGQQTDSPAPVEEWQIRGILAALKDEHPGVRGRAARKLAELLREGTTQGSSREWKGNSRTLAQGATEDLFNFVNDNGDVALALGRLGDKRALPELLKLLNNWNPLVREHAAEALGRLDDGEGLAKLGERLKNADSFVRVGAAEALGRLADKRAVLELRNLVSDANLMVRANATYALGLLGDKASVTTIRKLLGDQDESVREQAIEALGRLGDKESELALRKLLHDQDDLLSDVPTKAAEALVRIGGKEHLRGFLDDPDSLVRQYAIEALGRLGDREAVKTVRKLLGDPDLFIRGRAAEALGRLRDKESIPTLRKLLNDPNLFVRHYAVEALGRLGAKEAVPQLRELLNNSEQLVRERVVSALEELEPDSIIAFLQLPYEHTPATQDARWLAHYWCEATGDSRVLCAYLGRPASQPELPKTRETALHVLDALGGAWTQTQTWPESKRRWLREDLATWVSLIVTEKEKEWTAEDLDMLRQYKQRFANEKASRVRAYAGAIQRLIDPFETPPPPWWRQRWVRAVLAFGLINVIALFTIAFRPMLGGLGNWLPFLVYAGAGAGSWLAAVVAHLDLDPWLLAALLIGEFAVLIAAGLVSTATLRHVARIEPLKRVAVPLALRLPWTRRRIFQDHVASVRSQLDRDKRRANNESYIELPADIRTHANPVGTTHQAPAAEILKSLTGTNTVRGHVLIEAPGGRGKSALLRELVRQALDQFELRPGDSPLPVLLSGSDESIEKMLETTLKGVLVSPDALALHLEAGDFFVVLDGISESGPPDKVVTAFIQGPHGGSAPLLVSSRPVAEYRHAIEGAARWMVVEPRRLDEALLGQFVRHYGGKELPAPVQPACRGPDGTYLPILVRMAMTVGHADDTGVSVADIYRSYFLRLFEAQFPDEGERLKRLGESAQWCLKTYWRDGLRTRSYEADELQRGLLKAGVLIPADNLEPPAEVHFFHDSMQSYLTAHGLGMQDREGYQQLPRPEDDPAEKRWDRNRVLLWAAANEKFAKAQADILQTGGAELFQMCLTTFTPREGLRQWLRNELKSWATDYEEDLRRKDIMAAMPPSVADQVKSVRGAARLFAAAVDACFETDAQEDSVGLLGRQYAGMAPFIYEIRQTREAGSTE